MFNRDKFIDNQLQKYNLVGILIGLGVGIALAVALDNIAIGWGLAQGLGYSFFSRSTTGIKVTTRDKKSLRSYDKIITQMVSQTLT